MLFKLYFPIVIPFICISIVGVLNLFSVAPELYRSQLNFFLLGLLIIGLSLFINLDTIHKSSYFLYAFSVLLLVVLLVVGEVSRGAVRWITLGDLNIQPSELVKIMMSLAAARFLSQKTKDTLGIRQIVILIAAFVPTAGLILIQPDLGTAVIVTVIFVVMVVYAGLNKWILISIPLLLGILSAPLWSILQEYQKHRILSLLNPGLDPLGSGYNVTQSLIAIGSGGLWGKGYGMGTQSRLDFLPEKATDFAFAAFAEEWGFAGILMLIIFYAALMFGMFYLFYKLRDYYARYVVLAVMASFFAHIIINIGMNLGIMPVTGIVLPFFSYGGSSFVTFSIALGIVNVIAKSESLR